MFTNINRVIKFIESSINTNGILTYSFWRIGAFEICT